MVSRAHEVPKTKKIFLVLIQKIIRVNQRTSGRKCRMVVPTRPMRLEVAWKSRAAGVMIVN